MTVYISRGEIYVYFTALTNIRQWKNDGLGVSWAIPKEGTADCEDFLFVPRYLPESVAYCAKQYVAHAVTEKVQKDFGISSVCSPSLDASLYFTLGIPSKLNGGATYKSAKRILGFARPVVNYYLISFFRS
jgi:spermidine/putrescine-binding protein